MLVQGTARVDYSDLDANRERYWKESGEKLPATKEMQPPSFLRGQFSWYYTRIYVYVRPERVFVWSDGDFSKDPTLYGTHLEEVRSHHSAEPETPPPAPEGGAPEWDARMDELGGRHETAVLTLVGPDGFPFSLRLPIRPDRAAHRVHLGELPDWLPGRAQQGMPDRPRARPALRVADELPGPRRPRAGGRGVVPRAPPAGGRVRAAEEQAPGLPRELPEDPSLPQEGEGAQQRASG